MCRSLPSIDASYIRDAHTNLADHRRSEPVGDAATDGSRGITSDAVR